MGLVHGKLGPDSALQLAAADNGTRQNACAFVEPQLSNENYFKGDVLPASWVKNAAARFGVT